MSSKKPKIRAVCKKFECMMTALLESKKKNLMTKEELSKEKKEGI